MEMAKDAEKNEADDITGITMNLRKFRKATAKKRMLDNHKEASGKKKRKKSDNSTTNYLILEQEVEEEEEEEIDDEEETSFLEENVIIKPREPPSIGGDTTASESNTMTLEQFTDIVLASEGMTLNNNNKADQELQEEREKKAMVATILQNKDLTVEVKSSKSKPVVLSPRETHSNFVGAAKNSKNQIIHNNHHHHHHNSTVVVSVKPRVNTTRCNSTNLVEEWLQKMPTSTPTPPTGSGPSTTGGTTLYEPEITTTPTAALNLSVKSAQYSTSGSFKPASGPATATIKPCIMELSKSRAIRDIQLAHTKDVHGNFPLHMSVLMRKPELVKRYCCVLQILESSIDLINDEKLTPLHLAVRDNSVEIIEMLVAFGANPSIRDIRGNSSLHMATAIRSSESLKILAESLASKDDVNAFNNFGITPLHIAMMNDDKPCIDLLLRHGADPKILNDMTKLQPISKELKKESIDMIPTGFPRNNVLIHS